MEREEKEKGEAIALLHNQIATEKKVITLLHNQIAKEIKSNPVRHLLHMIQLDSMKHIDICQAVIDVLRGEDVLKEEKKEIIEGMKRHLELEKKAIDTSKKILKNVWIEENAGLKELIKKLIKDEEDHHKTLMKLTDKTFFRIGFRDIMGSILSTAELDTRYVRLKRPSRKSNPE